MVVDSIFTTSIPKIVLAAYSGVLVRGVKRRVTGRGPGTRAESCEPSDGEEQRVPTPPASFTIYLCVCVLLCVCMCLWRHSVCSGRVHITRVCILLNFVEPRRRLAEVRKGNSIVAFLPQWSHFRLSVFHIQTGLEGGGGENRRRKEKI